MDATLGLIGLFYALFWWLLLVSFIGLPVLLIMLSVPAWRRSLLLHPRKLAAIALVCVPVVGLTVYQMVSSAQDSRARNPRLDHDVQIGNMALPAGTRLHLSTLEPLDENGQPQVHGLASLDRADFAGPHSLAGMQVSAIKMYRLPETELLLVGDQVIDGWPCAGGSWLTMTVTEQTRLQPERWAFGACTLVGGTRIVGETWPAESRVYREDDHYSVSDWMAKEPVSMRGIVLSSVTVKLDKQRRLLRWDGQLQNPMTLGEWQYPHGMRVGQSHPGTLMFSPSQSYAARNLRTGEGLKLNHSILQRRSDGSVLWIKPNAEVNVADW
ncbi:MULTISPECIES: hypothetical protein [unclassified Pseudomonas]|jgi:hypothetical protein|uniref:hypothetical protein n=1 Tax=unclassified Pseudomonas TaxID=196821 RepID=UPI0011AEF79A|nr:MULTISPECIES: hypothetical protein [unclassified Pseudomonas]MDX9671667.1 hypothetical protein [Pseudomonas sp. P8_250]WPN34361.1 hypothetical protein QMK53_19410 [Pseudomonas sp. P8_139]WPN43840.1 hypothetical protein QMK55_11965 [Pseudomonas sp. P8_229]